MGMGEICGKLDGAWKTLGGNGAKLGKRGCNWARLGELLCRRVFVPARLPGGDPIIISETDPGTGSSSIPVPRRYSRSEFHIKLFEKSFVLSVLTQGIISTLKPDAESAMY